MSESSLVINQVEQKCEIHPCTRCTLQLVEHLNILTGFCKIVRVLCVLEEGDITLMARG